MSSKKLNIGCGNNKIPGYINIDCEPSCKPDLLHNFILSPLPFKKNTVSEIVFFHTIEHIHKMFHQRILKECWRVLKPDARLIITYPEFTVCVNNWKTNYRGKKEYWEKTIFGRQLYPSDFHVCIMHTPDFTATLTDCGFDKIQSVPELGEEWNTIITAVKGEKMLNYEDLVYNYVTKLKIQKVA